MKILSNKMRLVNGFGSFFHKKTKKTYLNLELQEKRLGIFAEPLQWLKLNRRIHSIPAARCTDAVMRSSAEIRDCHSLCPPK